MQTIEQRGNDGRGGCGDQGKGDLGSDESADSSDADRNSASAAGENLSPVKFAKANGLSVGVVSYHFGSLTNLECLELVETIPRRGAMEHFYALTQRGKELLALIEAL